MNALKLCAAVSILFGASIATAQQPGDGQLRYNQVQQKDSHNTYQRFEDYADTMLYHRVRNVEIDIHDSNRGGAWGDLDGDWYVYHTSVTDQTSSCRKLSDCLSQVAAVHHMLPQHEVFTVFLDVKDNFDGGWGSHHSGRDLDRMILRHVPESAIVRPIDLMRACPSARVLRDAVRGHCAWPTLDSVRGKIMFVLTADDGALARYSADTDAARVGFGARGIAHAADVNKYPDSIFYNVSDQSLGTSIRDAGYVGRIWEVNDADGFRRALHNGFQHIATNKTNASVDPWSTTHNRHGWPFLCPHGGCDGHVEAGTVVALEAASGDIHGSSDSMAFLHAKATSGDGTWIGYIAAPSSHVESWAKGCLMARESLDPKSPFYAVCHPADNHPMFAGGRAHHGAEVHTADASLPPHLDVSKEGIVLAKLALTNGGKCAEGYSSADGVTWQAIGDRKCYAAPLHIQGLAVSSHGAQPVRFYFGNLKHDNEGVAFASFEPPHPVGGASRMEALDHW